MDYDYHITLAGQWHREAEHLATKEQTKKVIKAKRRALEYKQAHLYFANNNLPAKRQRQILKHSV